MITSVGIVARSTQPLNTQVNCGGGKHPSNRHSSRPLTDYRNHTNGDLLPYVCLSDHCLGTKTFSSSGDWAKHMTSEHGNDWVLNIHESLIWRCDQTGSGHEDVLHFRTLEDLSDHVRTVHKSGAPIDASPSMFLLMDEDIISKSPSAVSCPFCYRALQIGSTEKVQTVQMNNKAKRAAKVRFAEDVEAAFLDRENDPEDAMDSGTATVNKNVEMKRLLTSHIAEHLQRIALLTVRLNTGVDAAEGEEEVELSSLALISEAANSAGKRSTVDLPDDKMEDSKDRSDSDSHYGAMLINQIIELDDLTRESPTKEQKDLYFDTLLDMTTLASSYKKQGRWEEAEEQEVCVMETRKRVLGEEHPDTLDIMTSLALTYQDQNRQQKAEELGSREGLAGQRVQKAIEILEQVVAIREKVLDEGHPDRLVSQHQLTQAHRLIQEFTVAMPETTISQHDSINTAVESPQPGIFKQFISKPASTLSHTESLINRLYFLSVSSSFDRGRNFLPHGYLDTIITHDTVTQVLEAKTSDLTVEARQADQQNMDGVVDFIVEKCKKLFAILFLIFLDSRHLRREMDYFHAIGFDDSQLPLTTKSRIFYYDDEKSYRKPWNDSLVERFCETDQWRYLAPVFTSEIKNLELHSRTIFPFTETSRHGGAFRVHRVTIHPSHQKNIVHVRLLSFLTSKNFPGQADKLVEGWCRGRHQASAP